MIELHIIREDLDVARDQEKRILDALAAVRERIEELRDELVTETTRTHNAKIVTPTPYNGDRRQQRNTPLLAQH